ncbi:LysE/ArgO family amino acid transporter [Streptomyces acidiscabies]|uniref:Amino acid transporter n=1 Tax=Streptomyces acidiscabies TaxID=42234 RepID=A0A0L0JU03_9ACTN|nr:LysE/ArgO family amino acid transporter [Streptomyces acidiscabies]MBP5934744.1 amino acid transporter [Streptomyces sp. LBUM 1476]KND29023.1 amino acid transporter [Streptomyces acidiscabies]MBZ3917523.1 amino acid transporter [Streptomyces acidiscabies]MDX2962792.1 LysE/ArgO family amino acid transporter [Streptomyces acidiscabies]MDX3018901.1 LysE/ArgO family amino acid transporter [Streptomyces acidiscabies]
MPQALTAAAAGFGTGLSLIVAIGAQNAFVLRQGVRRAAVLPVVAICALSDAALIALGVGGVGALVVAWPGVVTAVGWIGGAFLLCYGALAARRVVRPQGALVAEGEATGSVKRAVLTCLALTWLNPHVYLDTVFLLGSVAADRGSLRWVFGLGAVTASLCWFAGLGFGARLLGRFLTRPSAWRVLDGVVAVTMIVLGITLIVGS